MIILALNWIGFGLLHSLLADLRVKNWMQTKLGAAYQLYRIGYNVVFLSWLGFIIYWLLIKDDLRFITAPSPASSLIGAGLVLIGLVLLLWSFSSFDLSEFSGLSYLRPTKVQQEKLRVDGLYKYVRHPLYFATFIIIAGFLIMRPTPMNLLNTFFLYGYTYMGTLLEERKLVQIFGEDYRQYQQRVKMLVPFLF